MIESAFDLASFTNASEFGDTAILTIDGVPLPVISGIIDTVADDVRPASTSGSNRSAFTVGAADVSVGGLTFATTHEIAAGATPECTLQVTSGRYIGLYRIRSVKRDGEIVRLGLNKK